MPHTTDSLHIIEENVPFSRSALWQLQRDYYESRGPAAWQRGEVPYYITGNPVIAGLYADLALAVLRDSARALPDCAEPLCIVELGAGHGRFGFYFLKALAARLAERPVLPPVRYLMTDLSEKNVAAWRENPMLAPFVASGLLDFCRFDMLGGDPLPLRPDGGAQPVARPLVVFANYVLDVIPYELFYLDGGTVSEARLTLASDRADWRAEGESLWEHLFLQYSYAPPERLPAEDTAAAAVLREYAETTPRGHLQFPAAALACIERLGRLSEGGCVLLSTDKGTHTRAETEPPGFVPHGSSFSNSVNFHAIGKYYVNLGGRALLPADPRESLITACFLPDGDPGVYRETAAAYARMEHSGSPARRFDELQAAGSGAPVPEAVLACLRLGEYDPWLLTARLPALYAAFPLSEPVRAALLDALPKLWDMRYGAVEPYDLAGELGRLCMALEDYAQATRYLSASPNRAGRESSADLLLCHYHTGDYAAAAALLSSSGGSALPEA